MSIEDLYRENYNIVYGYLITLSKNTAVAEELASNVFLKALSHLDSYDGTCKISSWLCQIAKNEYYKYYNKNKRFTDSNDELEMVAADFDVEKMFIDKELAMQIHKLLHKLDEPYKEVFILRIFAELSYAEIGNVFEKTESWARVTFHRAKLKIIAQMSDEDTGVDGRDVVEK